MPRLSTAVVVVVSVASWKFGDGENMLSDTSQFHPYSSPPPLLPRCPYVYNMDRGRALGCVCS